MSKSLFASVSLSSWFLLFLEHFPPALLSPVFRLSVDFHLPNSWHFMQRPWNVWMLRLFFPTCQVRVVRFYQSCVLPPSACLLVLLLLLLVLLVILVILVVSSSSSSLSNCDPWSTLFGAGPQPRPSMLSVPCRTSTTTIHAQCSLPDLNHEHPRPVFPPGPQPWASPPSVPCRTSTASIHAKCSLPDLM